MRDKSKDWAIVPSIVVWIIDFVLTGYTSMYIWNNVFSTYLGVQKITFWIGWLLSLAIGYFFRTPKIDDDTNAEKTLRQLINDTVYTLLVLGYAAILINFLV